MIRKFIITACALMASNFAFSEPCPTPRPEACMFYSPDMTYVGIQVFFKHAKGTVYVDGGCSFGIHELSPLKPIYQDTVKSSNFEIQLTYCSNNQLIEKRTINIDNDTFIKCSADTKLICKKLKAN